jgi:hypothetical protein
LRIWRSDAGPGSEVASENVPHLESEPQEEDHHTDRRPSFDGAVFGLMLFRPPHWHTGSVEYGLPLRMALSCSSEMPLKLPSTSSETDS